MPAKMWVFNATTNHWQPLGGGDVAGGDHGALTGLGDNDHPQYVLAAGDTMTGGLTLTGAIGLKHLPATGGAQITSESLSSTAYFETRVPAARAQGLMMRTGATSRWLVGTDAAAESGGNAGTNFTITRYDDNGGTAFAALSISRATGEVTVAGDPLLPLGVVTKQYVDNRIVISDSPASGVYPVNTLWIEY